MATKPVDWRALDSATKFAYLANHYKTAAEFSNASGLSVKTIRSIFSVLNSGRQSRVLDREDVASAMRHARHRMTDHIRRTMVKAKAAKFEAPVMKAGPTVLQPFRYQLYLEQSHKVVESFWVSYHVEHLPFEQIVQVARELFELYMDTGQFNAYRFEYICDASVYVGSNTFLGKRRTFEDKGLYLQQQESDIVKISTATKPFLDFEGNPDKFEDDFRSEWESLKARGGIRITDLAYTLFEQYEKKMPLARADYKKYKNKKRHSGKINKTTKVNRGNNKRRGIS